MADKLYFYSRSRDVFPGCGPNEQVSNSSNYEKLSRIPDWRKVLSNFHSDPFVWNGKKWKTIEHAFQATKIALVDEEKAKYFELDSGFAIGMEDGCVAQKNRKMVLLDDTTLKQWSAISQDTMDEIAIAKYSQSKIGQSVLFATRDAELWHLVPRCAPIRFHHLEKIRSSKKRLFHSNLNSSLDYNSL